MSNFQTILVAIFLAFFVFAVLIFSGTLKIGGSTAKTGVSGKVVIWGTFTGSQMSNAFSAIDKSDKELSLSYQSKNPDTYQQDLIEAFANGKGPDLFIITPDLMSDICRCRV